MTKLLISLFLAFLTLVSLACARPSRATERPWTDPGSVIGDPTLSVVGLEIPTMVCASCQGRVENNARKVAGVIDVRFNGGADHRMVVSYDSARTNPGAIVKSIERGGDTVDRVVHLR